VKVTGIFIIIRAIKSPPRLRIWLTTAVTAKEDTPTGSRPRVSPKPTKSTRIDTTAPKFRKHSRAKMTCLPLAPLLSSSSSSILVIESEKALWDNMKSTFPPLASDQISSGAYMFRWPPKRLFDVWKL